MALYLVLSDAAAQGEPFLDIAEKQEPKDVRNYYVRAQFALVGASSSVKQEKSLSALSAVRESDPMLLRALYDIGAIEFDRHEYDSARKTLQTLLSWNGKHERGKFLLQSIPNAQ